MTNSILPADLYVVVNKSVITEQDKIILEKLYLPIIGPTSVMLYQLLVSNLDNLNIKSEIIEHNYLLNILKISTEELYNLFRVLEGIGLIRTYIKKDTINSYIYELYSPVTAHEFFNHPIFNIVLYNNIGKKEYEKLLNYFKLPKVNKDGYEEITAKFSSVFKSIPYTSTDLSNDSIRKYNKLKLNIDSNFDINFLIESMPKQIDKKIFTKDLQELIISLAYLYDIDVSKMIDLIRMCINERGTVSREELRKNARNHYQFDHSGLLPTVIEHTQPEFLRKPIGDNSDIAKMIYTFETTSPYDFLKSKCNGGEPLKRDLRLLENLIIDLKLKPGVVNVLVDFVLKTNDNKLNTSLVETIAGQWARKNIETVEEAMDTARKNYKPKKNIQYKNEDRKIADIPVWFDKNIQENKASEEEKQEMDDLLKEFR